MIGYKNIRKHLLRLLIILILIWLLTALVDMTRTVYERSINGVYSDVKYVTNPVYRYTDLNRFMAISSSSDKNVRRSRHTNINIPYRAINPFQYRYILDVSSWSNRCSNLSVLLYVHTALKHREQREKIRATYGSVTARNLLQMDVAFMVGHSTDESTNRAIREENDKYGDLIQEDYIDSYGNMSLKAISALKFICTYCSRVPIIVKSDDDIYVNIAKLREFLFVELPTLYFNTNKMIMCNMWTDGHPFRTAGKWGANEKEYKFKNYPIFCQGAGYILTSAAVHALFRASNGQEFYKFDDVFLTGILTQKAGVSFHPINDKYSTEAFQKRGPLNVIFSVVEPHVFQNLWDQYVNSKPR